MLVLFILIVAEWGYGIVDSDEDKADLAWLLRLGAPWRQWRHLSGIGERYARHGEGPLLWSELATAALEKGNQGEFGDVGTAPMCARRAGRTLLRLCGVPAGLPGHAQGGANLVMTLTADGVFALESVAEPQGDQPAAPASTPVDLLWIQERSSLYIADEKVCS